MSAITATPSKAMRSPAGIAALWQLTITELKLSMRDKVGPIWGLAFPAALLIIFGSIPSFRKPSASFGGYTTLDAYVPILILFSIALLSLVPMPMVLVGYRERGVLRRLQTTPAGPIRVLAAQLVVNLVYVIVATTIVLLVAKIGYGVFLPRKLAGFALTVLLTFAALMAMGLFVAALGRTVKTAQLFGMVLFYPTLFFSGLWYPLPLMPTGLQHLAHATPLGAAWEAMATAAVGHWPPMLPLITLAIYAVVFGSAAARFFRWE